MNDARYAFFEDVRNRSRSTGKRATRWKGGVIMPSDLTKTKRREKATKVERINLGMYWNEFQKQARHIQSDLLRTWAKDYTPSEIAQGLGCKTTSIIPLIKHYQITYPTREREEMKVAEKTLNITYEQFKELTDEERIFKHEELKKKFSDAELSRRWGLGRTVVTNIMAHTRTRIFKSKPRWERVQNPKEEEAVQIMIETPKQDKQTLTAEEVVNLFTRIDSRIKELEADNERLKKIETAYNSIVSVLGNAMKGVGV